MLCRRRQRWYDIRRKLGLVSILPGAYGVCTLEMEPRGMQRYLGRYYHINVSGKGMGGKSTTSRELGLVRYSQVAVQEYVLACGWAGGELGMLLGWVLLKAARVARMRCTVGRGGFTPWAVLNVENPNPVVGLFYFVFGGVGRGRRRKRGQENFLGMMESWNGPGKEVSVWNRRGVWQ